MNNRSKYLSKPDLISLKESFSSLNKKESIEQSHSSSFCNDYLQGQSLNQIDNSFQTKSITKPFEKDQVSFKTDDKNQLNDTFSKEKFDDSTNVLNNTQLTNKTRQLSIEEKSYIKSISQNLSTEEISKAIQYNSANNDSTPFWLKYFIDNVEINENSAYFKAEDKKEYIDKMIIMTKNDSKLFDTTNKHKNAKQLVADEIKALLITEINDSSNNTTTKMNKKLENILTKYENKPKTNMKKIKKDINLNVNDITTENIKKFMEEEDYSEEDQIEEESKDQHSEVKLNKKIKETNFVDKNKQIDHTVINKYKGNLKVLEELNKQIEMNNQIDYDSKWKLLTEINMNNEDDEEAVINNIPDGSLLYYRPNTLKQLSEIDKKLSLLEKERHKFEKTKPKSTNTNTISLIKDLRETCKNNNKEKSKAENNKQASSRETIFNKKVNHKQQNLKEEEAKAKQLKENKLKEKKEFEESMIKINQMIASNNQRIVDDKEIEDYINNCNFDIINTDELTSDDLLLNVIKNEMKNIELKFQQVKENNTTLNQLSKEEEDLIRQKQQKAEDEENLKFYDEKQIQLEALINQINNEELENNKISERIDLLSDEINSINTYELEELLNRFKYNKEKLIEEFNQFENILDQDDNNQIDSI